MHPRRPSIVCVLLAALALFASGCGGGPAPLVIATTWPAAECKFIEDAFRKLPPKTGDPTTLRWIRLAPGDDIGRIARRSTPPDLLLGGPATTYQRLELEGRLEPAVEDGPEWRIARRLPLGLLASNGAVAPVRFDDPRRDPVSLEWARSTLATGEWAAGYAKLVLSAAGPQAPGRSPGAAVAARERGEAAVVPAVEVRPSKELAPLPGGAEFVEGVAVVHNGRNVEAARELVRDLARNGHADLPAFAGMEAEPEAVSLLADLLGAALVDSREELLDARDALRHAPRADRSAMWMTQPPPWPPASVAKILSDGGAGGEMPLLETLVGQLAPEADVRAWLLRSWIAPGRLVDANLLREIASAADGRLAREPRFRQWLRSEWTAWARQRYRRVARKAELGIGPETPDDPAIGASS